MGFTIFFIFLSLISLISSKSIANNQSAIVGGVIAKPDQFPFAVYLEIDGKVYCTATIISNEFILTAAHCVIDSNIVVKPPYDNIKVVSGTISLTNEKQIHDVLKIFIHPKYDYRKPWPKPDVALIKLKKPIKFNKNQRAIDLPVRPPVTGRPAILIGWGRTTLEGASSNLLRFLNTKLIDGKTCAKETGLKIGESEVCEATTPGHSACYGDSGGPLISEGKIVGITSFGTEKCEGGYPDISENVFHYKPLILQWMKAK